MGGEGGKRGRSQELGGSSQPEEWGDKSYFVYHFPKDKEQLLEKGSVLTVHGNGGTLTQMHKKL